MTLSRNSAYSLYLALKNTLTGKFEYWRKVSLSSLHRLFPLHLSLLLNLPSVNHHVSKANTFSVTIFHSIAMFSCHFTKVAILYLRALLYCAAIRSEGSGDKIAK